MRRILMPVLLITILFVACTSSNQKKATQKEVSAETFTNDGTWCWFSNPRAVYYNNDKLITGWVKKDGSVEAASLDLTSGEKQFKILFPQLEIDDHDNPAFTILPNGNVLAMYTWHSTKKGVLMNTTTNGGDISSFGESITFKPTSEALLERFPRETYTYANPFVLSEENNKLFVFGRWTGFKPNLIVSDDNGQSWSEKYVIVSDNPFTPDNRPYVNYYSDGKSKIHMIFTDGHPRNEPLNSVYYCYYENGAFWKVDGSKICKLDELPFEPKDASVVYKATEETGRSWIADIVVKDGQPVILYSRHPEETDHRYRYAWYNAEEGNWIDHEICKAGRWFPQTPEGEVEREPHYMGNLTFDPANPETVYLSRQINGRFEIEKHVTSDGGENWKITPITSNSTYDQVRPYVPRNKSADAKTVVMWMENKKYIHYTDYDTSIKYFIDE
ncbi:BNR-4 repeat-containing protein [Maribellus sediminis]|uniref:BNR-4 repeat-containing protein n=1 Tax=Maribellus sediminis TaxID=2696285 RepID=UPI001F11817F|nr:BNR-4 repeat-containing protein [Maribellus sediminis]